MTTFDFKIISQTGIPGISLICPQNEDAYNYLVEEADMTTLIDGSSPIDRDQVGDFISDAESAHLCSLYL